MGWSSCDHAFLLSSRLSALLLYFAAAGLLVAGEQPLCGCSWSGDHHCGISAKQLVKAVTGTRVSKICGVVSKDGTVKLNSGLNQTCDIHKRIQKRIAPFRACLDAQTSEDCAKRSAECEWEAQKDDTCGIDPEKLVMRLVNVTHAEKRHHFVKWISESDRCINFTQPECTKEKDRCQWLKEDVKIGGATYRKHCDVALGAVLDDLLDNSHAYQMIHIYMDSATCLAHLENTPNFTQAVCPMACATGQNGECMLPRHADSTSWPVMELQDTICSHSKKCEPPCKKDGKDGKCTGPSSDIASYLNVMTKQEWEIIDVMMVLSAAAAPYQLRCEAITSKEECSSAPDFCEGFIGIPEGAVAPTFGLSGRVGSLIRKTFDGSLAKEVSSLLDENPDLAEKEANKMTKKFVDKIGEYIPWGPDPVTTTTAKPVADDKAKKPSGGVGVLSMSLFVLALLLCGAVVWSGLASSKQSGRPGVEMKLDPAREYQRAPGA